MGRGRGTWGRGDAGTRGRGDAGTRGRRDVGPWGRGDVEPRERGGAGTWGRGDVVREDFATRRRAGIRGRDKQIAPDFCAELVKYFFEGQT